MASNGTAFTETSALTDGDDPTGGFWPFGDVVRLQIVRQDVDDSEAPLVCAGEAIARVEHEIDELWHDSMLADDRSIAERLAEVSHVLHRAARLLEHEDTIG